jgi:hypothetical protein
LGFSPLSSLGGRQSGGGGYDPDQPRVPAGNPDGGQWTSLGALLGGYEDETLLAAHSAEALDIPDDLFGPRILPDRVEQPKLAQSRSDANTNLIPAPALLNPVFLELVSQRYRMLAAQAQDGQQAIFTFKAREFSRGDAKQIDIASVRLLERAELEKLCTKNKVIQSLTDEATMDSYKDFTIEERQLRPAAFGSRVHLRLHKKIEAQEDPRTHGMESELTLPRDGQPVSADGRRVRYGTRDTIRLDVLYRETETPTRGCVNDIKTGAEGLDGPRAAEIALRVSRRHPELTEIFVTETRPFE